MDKEQDLKLLAIAFCENLEFMDAFEYGSIGLDFKRPFGNSYVQGDILEIIQAIPDEKDDDGDMVWSKEQENYADELYQSLPEYFKSKVKPFLNSL